MKVKAGHSKDLNTIGSDVGFVENEGFNEGSADGPTESEGDKLGSLDGCEDG